MSMTEDDIILETHQNGYREFEDYEDYSDRTIIKLTKEVKQLKLFVEEAFLEGCAEGFHHCGQQRDASAKADWENSYIKDELEKL